MYFIDENFWGWVNECGILEDLWVSVLVDFYDWMVVLEDILDIFDVIELIFEYGVLSELNGE